MFGKWHLGWRSGYPAAQSRLRRVEGLLSGLYRLLQPHLLLGHEQRRYGPGPRSLDNGRRSQQRRYFTEMVGEWTVDYVDRMAEGDAPSCSTSLSMLPTTPCTRRVIHEALRPPPMGAVGDGRHAGGRRRPVGAVVGALEAHGLRDNTCIFFQSDNGPSRETRNWLNDSREPYYGGTVGPLKGHKFSLYEGGIRVPALMSFPGVIPPRQTIDEMGAAMDVVPTMLRAAGIDASGYSFDGRDLTAMLTEGATTPHEAIYWEQGEQTAVRRGDMKLVHKGQLVEGAPPDDEVHLADVVEDIGEAAQAWRADLEAHWEMRFAGNGPATAHRA